MDAKGNDGYLLKTTLLKSTTNLTSWIRKTDAMLVKPLPRTSSFLSTETRTTVTDLSEKRDLTSVTNIFSKYTYIYYFRRVTF